MTNRTKARAWYVKYRLDTYALGPLQFQKPVTKTEAIRTAARMFGEKPREVWIAYT